MKMTFHKRWFRPNSITYEIDVDGKPFGLLWRRRYPPAAWHIDTMDGKQFEISYGGLEEAQHVAQCLAVKLGFTIDGCPAGA